MRVEELHLKNFCSFKDLDMTFPESNLAVFIGINGAGKTSILKSMTLSLSWLVARIERDKGSGSPIADLDILNGESFAQIEIETKVNNQSFKWSLAKTAKGRKKQFESSLGGATQLADVYKSQLTENNNSSLPLIIYYPVERSVLDVPLKIRTKHNFSQLDGYDNALSQGVDFRRFFEWFRDREDIENEKEAENIVPIEQATSKLNQFKDIFDNIKTLSKKEVIEIHPKEEIKKFIIELEQLIKNVNQLEKEIYDPQLSSVRSAIKSFMPDFDKLRIQRRPLRMLVDKKDSNKPIDILQLSQGEKSLMALVGDIARRLAMMNPELKNPLEGRGVVLIDEIELHLHPGWQRSIIINLQKTFPNIQFIVTTHSPQVLSRVHKDDIFILKDNKLYQPSSNPVGRDSTDILDEIMEVTKRPEEIQKLSDSYFSLINKNQFEEAQKIRDELLVLVKDKKLDKDDPIFIRADGILARKQLLRK